MGASWGTVAADGVRALPFLWLWGSCSRISVSAGFSWSYVCKSMTSFAWGSVQTARRPDESPDAGTLRSFSAAPASCCPQTFGSEPYTRTTSAITEDISGWPRHLRA